MHEVLLMVIAAFIVIPAILQHMPNIDFQGMVVVIIGLVCVLALMGIV